MPPGAWRDYQAATKKKGQGEVTPEYFCSSHTRCWCNWDSSERRAVYVRLLYFSLLLLIIAWLLTVPSLPASR